MPPDFDSLIQAEFPRQGQCYLNAASTGPLPRRAITAVTEFTERRGRPGSLSDRELAAVLATARGLAAELIGCRPGHIALTSNTSNAINLAAAGLPLAQGDIVLISAGEFPANVYPWLWLRDRGVSAEFVPATESGWPNEELIAQRLRDPRVKALAISWVQSRNGYAIDIARLVEVAHANGVWLLLDAMQGLGVAPFDLTRTPVDFLACGGQKWLLAPWGTGFAYVSEALFEVLRPPTVGWMAFAGTDDFTLAAKYPTTLHGDARRFEIVTLPFQDFVGFNGSLQLLAELGIDLIRRHVLGVQQPLIDWAAGRGWLATPDEPLRRAGVVAVAPPDPAAAKGRLDAAGIVTSLRDGLIRVSVHCYNTADEIERLIAVLDG